ncbi:hemolysin family protein [Treponema succinifaciens]|uniref:HlyC/CorC family transporter n=1 Tax=Treponema succinifaciens TaxID=167 RepID=UPI0023F2477B|nr:hemolysin family protein [Treponema succinifaciens]
MPDGSIPLLVSLFVLIAFSAFFSATETAYTSASRIRLKSLATGGNRRAEKVLALCENSYDKLLSTILIGNNIVNLSASTISALLFAKILFGSRLNPSIVSTAAITVVVLIFGEITPKYIGKFCAEKLAMAVYPFISILIFLFYPLNIVFSGWKKLIVRIFRFKAKDVITEEEIITMVEEAEEDGTIKKEETNLIRSVIEFDDLDTKDVLVPRVNICAVEASSAPEEIMRKFEESGFSRIPVYEGDIDTIIGIIHEKDFFRAFQADEKNNSKDSEKSSGLFIKSIMQKPFFAIETTKISLLLRKMQKERNHMAIVIDEYGGTSGLITMEDILEELVGEIYDEHDSDSDSGSIKPCGENAFIVSGETSVSKMMKYFELDEDETSGSTTVSGWITEKLGDFPEEGKKLRWQDKIEIEVLKTDKNTIRSLKVVKL